VNVDGDMQTVDARPVDSPPAASRPVASRAFGRAAAVGGALAAVVFTWMCSIGRLDLLQSHTLDSFYDSQSRALLAGHWDIPRAQLGFEAFVIGNKTYTYFGPWPSVLRMPVELFTHQFDGRLTQFSILLAFAVFMVATARLLWRVRELVRGEAAMDRLESVAVATFMLAIGAGSVVLFLASRPVVYHEAELWGAAWAVCAFAAILELEVRPTARAVLWSGVFTGLALLTRGSVGLAAFVALGLVFVGHVLRAWRRRANRSDHERDDGRNDEGAERLYLGPLLVALAVPIALYAYVNYARFGTLFSLPIGKQIATTIDPIRPSIFAGTHGSLFAPKYVPTDLVALVRPDAISFTRVFPWITFPARAHVLGHVTFAAIDPSSSLPASMTFLFVLGVIGVVALFRRAYTPLRVLAIGGLVGGLGVVTIPFINERYLSDFMPLVVVTAAAGLYLVLGAGPRFKRTFLVVFALLAAFSLAANFALALIYQRAYSPFTGDGERAAFVRFQRDAPGGSYMSVHRGDSLPPRAFPGGTLFVLGNCDAVYWSDGKDWRLIEQAAPTGRDPVAPVIPGQPASPGGRDSAPTFCSLLTAG
jgi:hypothetical protein